MIHDNPQALYNEALYYDIAFGWSQQAEADFLVRALKFHGVGREMNRVLEPACGTGRMLIQLAQNGLETHGYDLSAPMVDFVRERIAERDLSARCEVAVGDMRHAQPPGPFDGAINLVNGLSYLVTDHEIRAHLRDVGENLRPGAAYIAQLTLTDPDRSDYEPQVWTRERAGVSVTLTWGRTRQDFAAKVNTDYSRLEVTHGDEQRVFTDEHRHRMWFLDDLQELLRRSECFELAAIYDGDQRPVKLDAPNLDQLHIPYFVLKRGSERVEL